MSDRPAADPALARGVEEARKALAAHDTPPTETRSRAWGEYQIGDKYTRVTGEPFECEVNRVRVKVPIGCRADRLPEVPECDCGGWNERYLAHVGRALVSRFPHLDAECEALRVYQHPAKRPGPEHLRAVLTAHDALLAALRAVVGNDHSARCDHYRSAQADGCEFADPDPACPGCAALEAASAALSTLTPGKTP